MRYTLFHNQDALWFRPGSLDDIYLMGYSGSFLAPDTGSIEKILETIWGWHNRDDRPDRLSHPSLSVGDVVVLAPVGQAGEPWMFTVDVVGWKEL
jgi:hypothetical protein